MKRISTIPNFIIVIVALLFVGCNSVTNNKVGLLIHEMEGRWFSDVKYLEQYASEAGIELIIKNAGNNENLQLAQAEELIKEGVEVIIVVAVNQNTAAGIVRTAHNDGVKVIAYDRIISNADLDYLISYEYAEIGKMQAEYSFSKVPNGNYVMLWGDASDNNAQLMRKGQEEFLKPHIEKGNINIVYQAYVEEWNERNATHIMKKVLEFSDQKIDVVLASNDNIALAVFKTFDMLKMPKPKVITGQDATDEACLSIFKNEQTMTIYKSNKEMAKAAIGLSASLIANDISFATNGLVNNNRKEVPTMYLKPQVVDIKNLDVVSSNYSGIEIGATEQIVLSDNSNK